MSRDSLIEQLNAAIDAVDEQSSLRIYEGGDKYQPWGDMTLEETEEYVLAVFQTVFALKDHQSLFELPINYLTTLVNHLTTFNQQVTALAVVADGQIANEHHICMKQIQAFDINTRNSGLFSIINMAPDFPGKSTLLDQLIERAESQNQRITSLVDQVNQLIDPSVAGSLSKSFSARVTVLESKQKFWQIVTVASVITATIVTVDIVGSILQHIADDISWLQIPSATVTRLVVAGPIYFILIFGLTQLRKDRDLEEVYAHKSAIAATLPNYRDLITDPEVKDRVTSSATEVVFQLPDSASNKKSAIKGVSMRQLEKLANVVSKMSNPSPPS